MCYPKPGPRCSAHAAAAFTQAKENYKHHDYDPFQQMTPEYQNLIAARDKAQLEYDATPAGMAELERRIKQEEKRKTSVYSEYVDRLALGKAHREAALAALKAEDVGDVKHEDLPYDKKVMKAFDKSFTNRFIRPSKPRVKIENGDKRLVVMNEASKVWVNKLNTEETEAVAWMTSDGSYAMNGYLGRGKVPEDVGYTKEHVEKSIKALESAIDKTPLEKPVVVYRGLNDDVAPKEVYDARFTDGFKDAVHAHFKKGDTYSAPVFQSTSLDPIKGRFFARSGVIFEMKTKKAAPVSSVSAWEFSEKEMVVQRNTKFVITGVHEDVVFDQGDYKQASADNKQYHKFMVVQMTEID
jgi:hypothetical protein